MCNETTLPINADVIKPWHLGQPLITLPCLLRLTLSIPLRSSLKTKTPGQRACNIFTLIYVPNCLLKPPEQSIPQEGLKARPGEKGHDSPEVTAILG